VAERLETSEGDNKMTNDPKAWTRQVLAVMFGAALIACVVIYMLALAIYGVKIQPPDWFIGVSTTYLIGFGVSREVEKWKK